MMKKSFSFHSSVFLLPILSILFLFSMKIHALEFVPVSTDFTFKLKDATVYQIKGHASSSEEVFEHFKDYSIQRVMESEYIFDHAHLEQATLEDIKTLLTTDHTSGYGGQSWSELDWQTFNEFYSTYRPSLSLAILTITDRYYSGTGITSYVLLWDRQRHLLYSIAKTIYTE